MRCEMHSRVLPKKEKKKKKKELDRDRREKIKHTVINADKTRCKLERKKEFRLVSEFSIEN
jgi:hypothetical protein